MSLSQLKFNTYNNVVSVGCMCSTAIYLRNLGVRSKSCFFDWINIESFETVIDLIESGFAGCIDEKYLRQNYKEHPHIVSNTKYGFDYVHLFDKKQTFKKQYNLVSNKVAKSITNFKESLSNDCLLVYYSRSSNDTNWIERNQKKILNFCCKYKCDIFFVLNFEVKENFLFKKIIIPQNNIHKPFGGGVSYPFTNTEILNKFLLEHYSDKKRSRNLKHKNKFSFFDKCKKIIYKFTKDKLIIGD